MLGLKKPCPKLNWPAMNHMLTSKNKCRTSDLKYLKGESVMSDETLTAVEEKDTLLDGKRIPPLNLEDDEGQPDSTARGTARSTLERFLSCISDNILILTLSIVGSVCNKRQ